MTLDDAAKAALGLLGLVAGALVTAVARLFERVRQGETDSAKQAEQIAALKAKVADQLTQECVREVLDDALAKRDQIAAERRQRWDDLLELKIRQAVMEGVQECQRQTRKELEEIVTRIIRQAFEDTGQHKLPRKGAQ